MAYRISRSEMETTIRWDAEEKVAHIWTCDPVYIRKLDKLVAEAPEAYKCTKRTDDGAWYEVAAKYIRFGKPVQVKEPSEAQLEARKLAAERLRQMRASKSH